MACISRARGSGVTSREGRGHLIEGLGFHRYYFELGAAKGAGRVLPGPRYQVSVIGNSPTGWTTVPLSQFRLWQASAASGNVCLIDDAAESFVVGVVVAPDDVPADHAGLLFVAGVVGAVERKVPQRGKLGLDAV